VGKVIEGTSTVVIVTGKVVIPGGNVAGVSVFGFCAEYPIQGPHADPDEIALVPDVMKPESAVAGTANHVRAGDSCDAVWTCVTGLSVGTNRLNNVPGNASNNESIDVNGLSNIVPSPVNVPFSPENSPRRSCTKSPRLVDELPVPGATVVGVLPKLAGDAGTVVTPAGTGLARTG
jgi:hypothetical protein